MEAHAISLHVDNSLEFMSATDEQLAIISKIGMDVSLTLVSPRALPEPLS